MATVYELVKTFKNKYPSTIAWRLKKNASVVQEFLNLDEKILYVFTAQKTENSYQIFNTCVVTLTSKRILVGRKRVLFGYFLDSITPDMFNDLNLASGLIWGRINIDTIKEVVKLSCIDKKALDEIETAISSFMMEEKKKYRTVEKESK